MSFGSRWNLESPLKLSGIAGDCYAQGKAQGKAEFDNICKSSLVFGVNRSQVKFLATCIRGLAAEMLWQMTQVTVHPSRWNIKKSQWS